MLSPQKWAGLEKLCVTVLSHWPRIATRNPPCADSQCSLYDALWRANATTLLLLLCTRTNTGLCSNRPGHYTCLSWLKVVTLPARGRAFLELGAHSSAPPFRLGTIWWEAPCLSMVYYTILPIPAHFALTQSRPLLSLLSRSPHLAFLFFSLALIRSTVRFHT